jgi:putative transposase
MRFIFIQSNVGTWPIRVMCRVLQVVPSSFYAWRKRPHAQRFHEDAKMRPIIHRIFEQTEGNYGSPRMTKELRAMGYRVNEKRIARLMADMGIQARHSKQYKPVTTQVDPSATYSPDLIQQDFTAFGPNRRWVGDITYLAADSGWLYLATVLDLYSRRVVGWAMSRTIDAGLACSALRMAIGQRDITDGLIFHSDRGSQYTSRAFRSLLHTVGIQQSMSRKGCCYDNAVAESFFHSLKVEWLHGRPLANETHVRQRVFHYIEGFYNRVRRHSFIGLVSPADFERQTAAA